MSITRESIDARTKVLLDDISVAAAALQWYDPSADGNTWQSRALASVELYAYTQAVFRPFYALLKHHEVEAVPNPALWELKLVPNSSLVGDILEDIKENLPALAKDGLKNIAEFKLDAAAPAIFKHAQIAAQAFLKMLNDTYADASKKYKAAYDLVREAGRRLVMESHGTQLEDDDDEYADYSGDDSYVPEAARPPRRKRPLFPPSPPPDEPDASLLVKSVADERAAAAADKRAAAKLEASDPADMFTARIDEKGRVSYYLSGKDQDLHNEWNKAGDDTDDDDDGGAANATDEQIILPLVDGPPPPVRVISPIVPPGFWSKLLKTVLYYKSSVDVPPELPLPDEEDRTCTRVVGKPTARMVDLLCKSDSKHDSRRTHDLKQALDSDYLLCEIWAHRCGRARVGVFSSNEDYYVAPRVVKNFKFKYEVTYYHSVWTMDTYDAFSLKLDVVANRVDAKNKPMEFVDRIDPHTSVKIDLEEFQLEFGKMRGGVFSDEEVEEWQLPSSEQLRMSYCFRVGLAERVPFDDHSKLQFVCDLFSGKSLLTMTPRRRYKFFHESLLFACSAVAELE